MAGLVFTSILQKAIRTGRSPGGVDSREWFRDQARKVATINTKRLMMDPNKKAIVKPGELVHFFYDPKTKDDLPYYDTFPLVFPFRITNTSIYALNLHYLHPNMRAQLMDALYDLEDKRYKENMRLKLSYRVLKSASKFRYFKPCVKQYLFSHLRSQFLEIPHTEWEIALLLPTERFQKKSKQVVWRESRSKV